MYDRIRFVNTDGSVSLLDLSFSQVVEALKGLTDGEKDGFWNKKETVLADGRSAYLVKEGV